METNKQVIEELVAYFITQDQKVVARLLANAMIDFNRLDLYEKMTPQETKSFWNRVGRNALSVRKFAKDGPNGDLKPIVYESGDDE